MYSHEKLIDGKYQDFNLFIRASIAGVLGGLRIKARIPTLSVNAFLFMVFTNHSGRDLYSAFQIQRSGGVTVPRHDYNSNITFNITRRNNPTENIDYSVCSYYYFFWNMPTIKETHSSFKANVLAVSYIDNDVPVAD